MSNKEAAFHPDRIIYPWVNRTFKYESQKMPSYWLRVYFVGGVTDFANVESHYTEEDGSLRIFFQKATEGGHHPSNIYSTGIWRWCESSAEEFTTAPDF